MGCAQATPVDELPRIVFVIGGPGCGKGTQCKRIVKNFGYVSFSTGDLLRQYVKDKKDGYEDIDNQMKEGKLIYSSTLMKVLKEYIMYSLNKKIDLQQSEKIRLNYVFNQLCELENEKSSDDDSKSKKYLREINEKAKKKKTIDSKTTFKGKTEKLKKKNYKNKDEEDMEQESKKQKKKKFSKKALRKIIRKLCNEFAKDELDNMIWEVDENLDGYISEDEFENMYKKCITDENEEEGKKLFYLTQFLIYDKDEKHQVFKLYLVIKIIYMKIVLISMKKKKFLKN